MDNKETKKCPKCQELIQKDAKKCKHCGADLRNWFVRHKITTVILVLIVIGIFASAINSEDGNINETQNLNNTQEQTETTSKNKQEESNLYSLGEGVKVGDVRWKLINAKNRGSTLKSSESKYPSMTESKTISGKFIEIKMEVENLGKEMKSVTNLKLVDDQNRSFTSASDVSDWIPEGEGLFMLSNLNPNMPETFVDIYKVPKDATGLKVKVGDLSLMGDEEALIDLGL